MTAVTWADGHCRYRQMPFRRVFERVTRTPEPDAEIVTAYTDGSVTFRRNRRLDGYHEAKDTSGYKGVWVGDFVVHGLDILRGSVGVSDSTGAITYVCTVCRPIGNADPRYFAYVIRAQSWTGLPRAMARGIREGGADFRRWDTLAELPLPVPPVEAQSAIANFLDRETKRIDALVEKKKRLIELLDEKQTAVVDHAIDRYPRSAWLPVSAVCEAIADCVNKTAPTVPHETRFRMIRTSNVRQGRVDLEDVRYVEEDVFERWNRRGAPKVGDVLLAREAPLGEVGYLDDAEGVFLGQRLVMYRAGSLLRPRFMLYSFLSTAVQEGIQLMGAGSLHPHMRIDDCTKIRIPVPGLDEQDRDVAALDDKTSKIAQIVQTMQRQLELLAEYRQALITAAVTGQIDVDADAPEPEGALA